MKRLAVILLLLLTSIAAIAQTTKVKGRVLDADTGEPIPFVSVWFDGTTIGISTDLQGNYYLETRSRDAKVLTASIIGYYTQSLIVQQGSFSNVDFHLKQDINQLRAATVKPDNRYIRHILRRIDSARDRHNPEKAPDWTAGLYTKIEMDATNLEDLMGVGFINRGIGFVQDYADTSAATGKSYIPFMISESKSMLYHSREKGMDKEEILASKISGFEEENTLSQFTGSYLIKTNFYESDIEVFDLSLPSPLALSSSILYNYFLIDSLKVDGRKTYVLRFHPKKLVTSPTLDGEMLVDAEDFGLRSIRAVLSGESNVNWIRHINVDIRYKRLPDGRWFNQEEKLFLDLSLSLDDNSRIVSAIANRTMVYDDPVFAPITNEKILASKTSVITDGLKEGDAEYWEQVRPYQLSSREKGIFEMVDNIKQMPVFQLGYALSHALSKQFILLEGWPVEIGQWARFFSRNNTEGYRVQFGGRTTKFLSKTMRLSGYAAYGFKDQGVKWKAGYEWMLRRDLTRKLEITAKHDFEQLSSGTGMFSTQNMFSSMFSKNHLSMQSMVDMARIRYEHEFHPDVTATAELRTTRIWGNATVPLERPDGSFADSYGSDELRLGLRLSHNEKVTRNYFKKTHIISTWPVLQLNFTWAFKGIQQDTYPYLRADGSFQWESPNGVLGFGKVAVGAGAIWGSVPYTMLKLHEGNQTIFHDRLAFSCMRYYEFMSDRWVDFFYEHNFGGFFLGKIPLIKELEWRETATIRGAWGTLSDANSKNAPFKLMHDSGTLETPYIEAGFGLANIFRFFRIDGFWRLTHRSQEDPSRNFTINVGMDFSF